MRLSRGVWNRGKNKFLYQFKCIQYYHIDVIFYNIDIYFYFQDKQSQMETFWLIGRDKDMYDDEMDMY